MMTALKLIDERVPYAYNSCSFESRGPRDAAEESSMPLSIAVDEDKSGNQARANASGAHAQDSSSADDIDQLKCKWMHPFGISQLEEHGEEGILHQRGSRDSTRCNKVGCKQS